MYLLINKKFKKPYEINIWMYIHQVLFIERILLWSGNNKKDEKIFPLWENL